jgi:hypothetical protein
MEENDEEKRPGKLVAMRICGVRYVQRLTTKQRQNKQNTGEREDLKVESDR